MTTCPPVDADGEDTFELVIWVGYNIDWEDERQSFTDADDPDLVMLVDGRRIPFEAAQYAAFDAVRGPSWSATLSVAPDQGAPSFMAQRVSTTIGRISLTGSFPSSSRNPSASPVTYSPMSRV